MWPSSRQSSNCLIHSRQHLRGRRHLRGRHSIGYVFPVIVGAPSVTAEYRYQTIVPTFLANPVRWRVTIAKMLGSIPVGLIFALAATAVSVGLGAGLHPVLGTDIAHLVVVGHVRLGCGWFSRGTHCQFSVGFSWRGHHLCWVRGIGGRQEGPNLTVCPPQSPVACVISRPLFLPLHGHQTFYRYRPYVRSVLCGGLKALGLDTVLSITSE